MSEYIEVDGVMWCSSHHGVVDECSDHVDDDVTNHLLGCTCDDCAPDRMHDAA